jgi:chemotaxis response regulator CheB
MGMPNLESEPLKVAIIAKSSRQRLNLKSILETNRLQVVPDDELIDFLSGPNGTHVADVLLVDLDEDDEHADEELDAILDKTDLPILFNDSAATKNQYSTNGQAWGRRLAKKLVQLVEKDEQTRILQKEAHYDPNEMVDVESVKTLNDEQLEQDLERHLASLEKYEQKLAEHDRLGEAREVLEQDDVAIAEPALDIDVEADVETAVEVRQAVEDEQAAAAELISLSEAALANADLNQQCADRIWVLGASIGGPQAVKEFLTCLPKSLPMAFIIAQHIGKGFVPLLSEQMARICHCRVVGPLSGKVLANNDLLVTPTDKKIVFNSAGELILRPQTEPTKYTPSIDQVMTSVAERFGPRAGAIVFSGMGDDGMRGVEAIARNRGIVWAQSPDSCVISSMSDHARETGCVQYSGTPAELARRLVNFIERVS